MRNWKSELHKMVSDIRENNNRVPDEVCVDLASIMWTPGVPSDVKEKIGVIWKSSRCANGDMVALAIELLLATLRN